MIKLHEIQRMTLRLEQFQQQQEREGEKRNEGIEKVIELGELITNMEAEKTDLLAFIESLEAEVVE